MKKRRFEWNSLRATGYFNIELVIKTTKVEYKKFLNYYKLKK